MIPQELVQYCLDMLRRNGVQKAQGILQNTEKHELNVASGKISLLRTTHDQRLSLMGILDEKKGTVAVNQLDQASLDNAVEEVIAVANASQPDSAYDIAEMQPPKAFNVGDDAPQLDDMYEKLVRFLAYSAATYPTIIQNEITFDFTVKRNYFRNSNGVDFTAQQGAYNFMTLFAAKDGKQTSSFNASGFSTKRLDRELQQFGSLDTLLRQAAGQISTTPFPEKIEGDVIITPDCFGDFLGTITGYLGDHALISDTSIFKNSLHSLIADEHLTLRSCPVSDDIADGYFFTSDGYEAQNSTIIEKGVLKAFLLSLYGARKTGRRRAVNQGGAYIVEPGATSFEKICQSVHKGILLCRFSGGEPSENGDFSGVAKNSYYIENGEITYPLSETMISGNLAALLKNIRHISQERVDFGNAILPWIQCSGVTISGK